MESARALIDTGSELSFITEELVNRLRLPRESALIPLVGIGGTYSGRTKGCVKIKLSSKYDHSVSYQMRAFILSQLTFQIPSFEITHDLVNHFSNLQLADPHYYKPGTIDIIIGADTYGNIIKLDLIRIEPSLPIAQLTLFGWVISGPVNKNRTEHDSMNYHCAVDYNLQESLTRFWYQEEVGKDDLECLNPDEKKCEDHFKSTISRDNTGRYIVRLPFKSPITLLGNTSSTAIQFITRLKRKFEADNSYRKLYTEFMNEYEALGHMIPTPNETADKTQVVYLPHHGVLRENSQTTKLRVVFNGSNSSSSGISLNDILYSGAKLQADIFNVLLWFRLHRYVFSSDITKMYRQIVIHPDDRDFQRIFWIDSRQQLRSYQLTTVTYGLNCAPFLALRVMQQLVDDEGPRFPKAVPSLTRGRYVDDIFGGADSIDEALKVVKQVRQLCMAGGFPLQKWHSNCQELIDNLAISQDDCNSTIDIESSRVKVLGLCWQPIQDTFTFSIQLPKTRNFTKRIILSEISQLYDPLGFISPITIRAKIVIQELWLEKINWDTPLSIEFKEKWASFRQQLAELKSLSIPRWLHLSPTVRSLEIHGFSDASQLAMAAVIYIRSETALPSTHVTIVCAKTKVAPVKRVTIPRLELNAALLLARLVNHVQKALNLLNNRLVLWTDLSVALTWIRSHPSRWKDYVHNRVCAIQNTVPNAEWRFISGKENPADCATRGLNVYQLRDHSIWWTGPKWLKDSQEKWPGMPLSPQSETDLEERSKQVLISITNDKIIPWNLLNRYSNLLKLIRITAVCKRAVARFRNPNVKFSTKNLTPVELEQSRQFWIHKVQQEYFSFEIKQISKGCQLIKSNPIVKLTPFLDKSGLLRVGGRLSNTNLDQDSKHQYILPRNSALTILIIAEAHMQTLHGGTQLTLAYTRQKYWIVGGRAPVRSYILKCVRCARYRQCRAQQLMGQLPETRVTPSRPFLNSGVDYAGPITIKTWKGRAAKTYKGYIAVFVCFSTSAVHLEIVTDYSSETFIAAYKRFVARRGICKTLQSDNGTNFIGADLELRRRFNTASNKLKELASLLANIGTEWRFNPPSAPHFGGKCEAAVKSTKFHLRRLVGDTVLTYEELSTLLTQIEAILNSRPLCPMTVDVEDLTALTPGHFLVGDALTLIPEPNVNDVVISRLTRWQLIQQKVEQFWRRWTSECLQRYQAISKWHHPSMKVTQGSLVLMVDERYPPTKWPLARVTQLHPGKDGLVRVVTIRTATAIFKRPVNKICILPVASETALFGNSVPEGGRNVEER